MSSPLARRGLFLLHRKKRLFFMLTLDKVFDASNVLKEVIRPTACIHAPKVNPDCDVYLKTENLQVTGSFKVRGDITAFRRGKVTRRYRLLSRKPRTGRCSRRNKERYKVYHLSSRRRTYLKGRGNQGLWR